MREGGGIQINCILVNYSFLIYFFSFDSFKINTNVNDIQIFLKGSGLHGVVVIHRIVLTVYHVVDLKGLLGIL